MEFDSIQINKTAHLFNDSTAPGCNLVINYVYPVKSSNKALLDSVNAALVTTCFGNEYADLDAATAIDSFSHAYINDYRADLESLYLEDKKNNPQRDAISAWYSYYNNIEAHPITGNKDYLVYKIDMNSYTGGAHGMYSIIYLNFDESTGSILHLDKVFNPGYEAKLNELLLAKLMKDNGVSTLEGLQDKAYLQDTDIYPSDNFYIGNNEITFFYNVYEIAPYSSGTTEITLTFDELKDLMRKK